MGLDDSAMARLKRRRIEAGDGAKVTDLYQSISTMKDFGFTPEQWAKTSRLDRKILHYHRAAESYHMDMANTRMKERQTNKPTIPGPRQCRARQ